ncbi:unnamed protein product, partial [marine sediment metagenome]
MVPFSYLNVLFLIIKLLPFANITHCNSSIIGTKLTLKLGDYTITEGGFAADLGFEKFIDIVTSQYSEDKDVGFFYEKFKEKCQERIIQGKPQPACLFYRTEFGEIDQTEKLICQKCGKEALTCPICKQNLFLKEEIVREKNCGTLFQKNHITMWIRS